MPTRSTQFLLILSCLALTFPAKAEQPKWTMTLTGSNATGSFSSTESVAGIQLSGNYTRDYSGVTALKIATSSASSGPAPSAGSLIPALNLAAVGMVFPPLTSGENAVNHLSIADLSTCPTTSSSYAFAIGSWTARPDLVNMTSQGQVVVGTATYDPTNSVLHITQVDDINHYGVYQPYDIPATCDASSGVAVLSLNGICDRSGTGILGNAGILFETNTCAQISTMGDTQKLYVGFLTNGNTASASNLSGRYAALIYANTTGTPPYRIAKLNVNGSGVASGNPLSDFTNVSSIDTSLSYTVSFQTYSGNLVWGTLQKGALAAVPIACATVINADGNGNNNLLCASENPDNPADPFNIVATSANQALLSLSNTPTFDMGNVTGSTTKQLTLTNNGDGSASSVSVSVSSPFSIDTGTTTCSSTLAAGASCKIGVTFNPSSNGTYIQALSVSYFDHFATQTLSTNVLGSLNLQSLSLSPSSFTLDAGTSLSQAITATATYVGGATQNVTSVTSFSSGSASVSISGTSAIAASSGSSTITGTLEGISGTASATVSSAGSFTLSLSDPNSNSIASGGTYTYPSTSLGSPQEETFTVKNSGTGILVVSSITPPTGFTLTTALSSSTLTANQTATFGITAQAYSGGTESGTVTIASTAGNFTFTVSETVTTDTPTFSSISPTQGGTNGGTLVTITGTNIHPGTYATIGGANCVSPNYISSTSFSCTTPAGSVGAADVVVVNPSGYSSSTASGAFTYAASFSATGISPSSGTAFGGTSVTITGSGFASGDTVTIGGSSCTGVSVASSTSLSCTTGYHPAGVFDVVVSSGSSTATLSGGYTYNGDVAKTMSTTGDPGGRDNAVTVWTGSQLIVWGGYTSLAGGEWLYTGGVYDPVADSWTATPTPPSAMKSGSYAGHLGAWTGKQMIAWEEMNVQGGLFDPVANSWTSMSTSGAPSARESIPSTWTGKEFIVWGGFNGSSTFYNTGYAYNPASNSWRQIASSPLSARSDHIMGWTGKEVIVWSGAGTSNDTDGARYNPTSDTWASMSTTNSPGLMYDSPAVWTGKEFITWTYPGKGGRYNPATDTWATMSSTNAPAGSGSLPGSPTWSIGAAWTGSRMIVFGGGSHTSNYSFGIYDPSSDTWTLSTPTTAGREGILTQVLWTGSSVLLFGGYDINSSVSVDTNVQYIPPVSSSSNTWSATTSTGAPSARYRHSAVWTGSQMIVWGGYDGSSYHGDGAKYDPVADSWSSMSSTNAPSARAKHSAVWTGGRMLVWGGYDGSSYHADGGKYDPIADSWSSMSTTGAPSGSATGAAVWTGGKLIVWSGANGASSFLAAGGVYDDKADSWSSMATASQPTGRYVDLAAWTGKYLVVWGGYDGVSGNGVTATGGMYDPVANTWIATASSGAPSAREGHFGAWTGKYLIVWGGNNNGGTSYSDGALFNPSTNAWSSLSSTGAPSARAYGSSVWTGNYLIAWGGVNGSSFYDDGGRYDPISNGWAAMSTGTGVASGRELAPAVWTGKVMIVWGGLGTSALGDGSRYTP